MFEYVPSLAAASAAARGICLSICVALRRAVLWAARVYVCLYVCIAYMYLLTFIVVPEELYIVVVGYRGLFIFNAIRTG